MDLVLLKKISDTNSPQFRHTLRTFLKKSSAAGLWRGIGELKHDKRYLKL